MKLIPLSKERTEELENSTVPIENLTSYNESFIDSLFKIQSWYHIHGLTTKNSQKVFFDKLSELLGYEPLYYKKYEYKNAIWGFEWEGEEFILYKSKRGTSIQVPMKFRKDKLEKFLMELSELLGVSNMKIP